MAKTRDPLEKKKDKLDLSSTLFAIDSKNKSYYGNLLDEFKKQYSPFILLRYMSSSPDQSNLHEHHLLMANDFVNRDFWQLNKYPDFQHLLLTLVGTGKKQYHTWIAAPKREIKDKVRTFLNRMYPDINDLEEKIFYQNNTIEDFEELCKDYAMTDEEIKELSDNFKKLKEKNA